MPWPPSSSGCSRHPAGATWTTAPWARCIRARTRSSVTDTHSSGPGTAIVVLGLMGAGKTTVGRILAGILGWPLDDSDASIEAEQGSTVKELRSSLGVDPMHALEAGT